MSDTTGLVFDVNWWTLGLSLLALSAMLTLSLLAWRRSGWDPRLGLLEALRVLLVVMAVVTLWRPEWQTVFRPEDQPVLAILTDQSQSMQTRDVLDPANPRGEPMQRNAWLESTVQRVDWKALSESVDIVHERFGDESDPTTGTDIDEALSDAAKRHGNLRAVVLLSDGDWNAGQSPATAATRLRVDRVPVFAVPVGSDAPLPDVRIVALDPPTFSVVGKSLQVPFSIRSTLPFDYETEVSLAIDRGAQLKKTLTVPAMGQVRDVLFWTPDAVGDVLLSLNVPVHESETLKENNLAEVSVAIRAESLKVLVVESYPRWEYRYLRNALERDPGVDVNCLLLHPDISAVGGGPGYLDEFPGTVEALSKYDVVFLGDVGVAKGQLTDEQCQRLKSLVEKQASGLIFIPGMRGYQYSLLDTELDDLYPVNLDGAALRGFGSSTPGRFVLTELGKSSLLTKLADTTRENIAVWASLPGFQWRSPATRHRPGSQVLAIDEQSRAPLLVVKTYGTGKILFMGTDGAWRWREGVEDKYHYRFWGQVARWMAYQRHMAEGELLRVFYSPDRPEAGEVVTLNATVLDPNGIPLPDATVRADLVDPQGDQQRLIFRSTGADWGLYTSRFTPERIGTYQLTLQCQETAAVLEALVEVQGKQRELVGEPARPEVMEEIAHITRGQVIPYDQLATVCDQILQMPQAQAEIQRRPIWAHPAWAGLFIVLMTVFWIGRKMIGAI